MAGRDLTGRELEVAVLVAEGLGNKDVASRLGISERTVDNVVRDISSKLGVTSRVQIAARLAARAGAASSSRLPAPLSSFVGRETDLTDVSRLAGSRRLVTLVGPGGVGKTRLAIEVARMLEPRFADGADFVDLSGLADGELVEESALAALGLHSDTRRGAREILADGLRERNLLLVLDNCEHVLEACASLLDHLLTTCSRLHVLATSREPLLLRGERIHHVTPMELPDAGERLAEDALRRHSGPRLFVERAEEGGAAFPIGAGDAATIVQICRRLDGLPLALELAAARLRVMSPAELLAVLASHERFRILTAGNRTSEDRHRTLRAAVEWSYRLLTDRERMLFRRLSVFAGPFDVRAAERIGGQSPMSAAEVLEVLLGLVDKSLVTVRGGPGRQSTYRMLDTLRAFGRERAIELEEYEPAVRVHAHHYAELLAKPALTWTRASVQEVRDQLDDVRAALAWSCANEPALTTLICGRLVGFWGRHGHLGEGCQWMDRIIERLPEDDTNKAVAYANGSWLAQRHGNFELADRYAREELRIARLIGDDRATADALTRLGDIARNRDDGEAAIRYGEQGASMRRREGDAYELALALMILGSARGRRGAYADGRRELQEAARLFVSINEPSGVALCQGWLGELAIRQGELRQAGEQLAAALRAFANLQDGWMVANLLDLMAWLAGLLNEPIRVLRLAGAASALRERIGAAPVPALTAPLETATTGARRWLRARAPLLWRQGREAELAQAIAYAVRDVDWAMPGRTASPAAPGGLSQRELEVARLVARGLTDKEIAVRLGISVRTAEYHVEQIRRKLDCGSRTQIATWVVEEGLR
ncbi:MAG TPA: LuxR C-terminal-related transcriptional regulator [Candidatus Dormibacteraeota bacterium]|nr:LuxR C-terminal-related transcriptional regulator [Candidatus Dormibacteraeota bacterium]